MKYKNTLIFLIFVIFISLIIIYITYFKPTKKTISIFGSISKNIDDNQNLKKNIKYLAESLNQSYNYIIPNSKNGIIGYLLNNINKNNIDIITAYSSTFTKNNINEKFNIKIFDNPIDYEEYMVINGDIIIFLPGGIGTLYEISFLIFLLDVSDKDIKVLIYNDNGFFNFIKNHINYLFVNGYLRDNAYFRFNNNFLFFSNMEDLVNQL
jgi:predicted Rossmann-fold nucleotide-binding protein